MKERGQDGSVSVCIDADSLRKGNNITGGIWIKVANFQFPEGHWNDFPEIILCWWLDALFKLWSEKKAQAECLFMDGPYSYKVIREDSKHVLLCYHDTLSGKETEWEGEIELDLLLKQVLMAASVIIQKCQNYGWKTHDTETLVSRFTYIDGVINPKPA